MSFLYKLTSRSFLEDNFFYGLYFSFQIYFEKFHFTEL